MENQKIYGYLRVSTEKQNIDNCKGEILLTANSLNIPNKIIWIEETVSGMKHWRDRKLGELLNKFKKGDILITSEISRIGRTMLQILEFVKECAEIGVNIYCAKGGFKIDDSISSQSLIFALSLSSQIERNLISERTKTALKTKKERGDKLGPPIGRSKLDNNYEEIKQLINDGLKLKHIAKIYNCAPYTLSKFIKKHNLK